MQSVLNSKAEHNIIKSNNIPIMITTHHLKLLVLPPHNLKYTCNLTHIYYTHSIHIIDTYILKRHPIQIYFSCTPFSTNLKTYIRNNDDVPLLRLEDPFYQNKKNISTITNWSISKIKLFHPYFSHHPW